jgi:hypothetical protein
MLGLISACVVGVAGSVRLARHLPPGIDAVDGEGDDLSVPEPALA